MIPARSLLTCPFLSPNWDLAPDHSSPSPPVFHSVIHPFPHLSSTLRCGASFEPCSQHLLERSAPLQLQPEKGETHPQEWEAGDRETPISAATANSGRSASGLHQQSLVTGRSGYWVSLSQSWVQS